MKKIIVIFCFTFLLCSYSYLAEYLGEDIDGIIYDCTAYSYDTGTYYYVSAEFDGDTVVITFDNGKSIILTLDDEVIEDPYSIDAYDYERGVYWELDINDLE